MIQHYDHPYIFIPDRERLEITTNIRGKAAVFINLYYAEETDYYRDYLNNIPEYIDIYVISSQDEVLKQFRNSKYKTIQKENRGRDISALLIAAKPYIFKYDYICFCHDKKEKTLDDKGYVEEWRRNLFQNIIGTRIYLENLLSFMERNEDIGMLVPLPQHGRGRLHYLRGDWGPNYELTSKLIKELGIKAEVSPDILPFTFGTMFWARSTAIQKLYSKAWKYEDFPDEPLADDGEINHAIERVMQYLVEDAGLKVQMAVSVSYAERFMNILRKELRTLWDIIIDQSGIYYIDQLQYIARRKKKLISSITKYFTNHKKIYLYGAGKVAESCMGILGDARMFPSGILVTNVEDQDIKNGISIISIDEFKYDEGTGIIVAVGRKLVPEVTGILEKYGYSDYLVFVDLEKEVAES